MPPEKKVRNLHTKNEISHLADSRNRITGAASYRVSPPGSREVARLFDRLERALLAPVSIQYLEFWLEEVALVARHLTCVLGVGASVTDPTDYDELLAEAPHLVSQTEQLRLAEGHLALALYRFEEKLTPLAATSVRLDPCGGDWAEVLRALTDEGLSLVSRYREVASRLQELWHGSLYSDLGGSG